MADPQTPEERDEQEPQQRHEATEQRGEQGKRWGEIVVLVIVVVAYVLISIVLWRVLNNYVQPGDDPALKRGLVQAFGLILVSLAGAIGIYFTWRGQQHAREAQQDNQKNTLAQLELTQEQLKQAQQAQKDDHENTQEELSLTRQGQMTERFTKAVEQLASKKLEIRLGGIYSLERTAHEEKNYHWPIMEVLTSYVRRHAARKPEEESEENAAPPEPDIQAILDVIGRRSEDHRTDVNVEYGRYINLKNTDLRRANLWKAYLWGAILEEANLSGAILSEANLGEASLGLANLSGAYLSRANLDAAHFWRTNLRNASGLTNEQLEQANGDEATELPSHLKRPAHWIQKS